MNQKELKRDVAQAQASIAEVCMTDLLEEPMAEEVCVRALEAGMKADNACLDVCLQVVNYNLFKENFEKAAL